MAEPAKDGRGRGERRLRDEWLIERQGKKAVLYAGLLHLAHEEGLKAIRVTVVQCPSAANGQTAICAAEVETAGGTFGDVGDANPENVGRMVAAHIVRMAATRAKARALRDALDIGYVALEELGELDDAPAAGKAAQHQRPALREAPAAAAPRVAVQQEPTEADKARAKAEDRYQVAYERAKERGVAEGFPARPPADYGAERIHKGAALLEARVAK